jgi:hypothetical protein
MKKMRIRHSYMNEFVPLRCIVVFYIRKLVQISISTNILIRDFMMNNSYKYHKRGE